MGLLKTSVIIWIILNTPAIPVLGQFQYRFENISSDQGLSNGSILSILQDAKGFMYFGTNQGLNRYDGYKFKLFLAQSGNSQSLGNNNVRSLFEDTSGTIWVGTDGGLNKFESETETFNSYQLLGDSFDISNQILDIEQDHAGDLWLATHTYQTQTGGCKDQQPYRKPPEITG